MYICTSVSHSYVDLEGVVHPDRVYKSFLLYLTFYNHQRVIHVIVFERSPLLPGLHAFNVYLIGIDV